MDTFFQDQRKSISSYSIVFCESDCVSENCTRDNPLVVKGDIGGALVHRIYVDGGSSAEIMYDHCFQQMRSVQKATLQPPTTPLTGFSGQTMWPLGILTLPLTLYDYQGKGSKTVMIEFMVIRAPSPYNVILGRPRMKKLGTIA